MSQILSTHAKNDKHTDDDEHLYSADFHAERARYRGILDDLRGASRRSQCPIYHEKQEDNKDPKDEETINGEQLPSQLPLDSLDYKLRFLIRDYAKRCDAYCTWTSSKLASVLNLPLCEAPPEDLRLLVFFIGAHCQPFVLFVHDDADFKEKCWDYADKFVTLLTSSLLDFCRLDLRIILCVFLNSELTLENLEKRLETILTNSSSLKFKDAKLSKEAFSQLKAATTALCYGSLVPCHLSDTKLWMTILGGSSREQLIELIERNLDCDLTKFDIVPVLEATVRLAVGRTVSLRHPKAKILQDPIKELVKVLAERDGRVVQVEITESPDSQAHQSHTVTAARKEETDDETDVKTASETYTTTTTATTDNLQKVERNQQSSDPERLEEILRENHLLAEEHTTYKQARGARTLPDSASSFVDRSTGFSPVRSAPARFCQPFSDRGKTGQARQVDMTYGLGMTDSTMSPHRPCDQVPGRYRHHHGKMKDISEQIKFEKRKEIINYTLSREWTPDPAANTLREVHRNMRMLCSKAMSSFTSTTPTFLRIQLEWGYIQSPAWRQSGHCIRPCPIARSNSKGGGYQNRETALYGG